MSDPTWEISADLNSDGDYSDTNEALTANVISADWRLGMNKPYQYIAQAARATLVLRNDDNIYSPEHASAISGWDVGVSLRIRSTFSSTTRQHFIGWIKSIKPDPGQRGPRRARVEVEGFFARAQKIPVKVPLQQNKTGGQLITSLLEAATLYPPGATGKWFVAVAGQGELGQNTILGQISDYTNFDTGISTFPYAFDNSAREASLYNQMRIVAESEQGKVFVDRAGKAVFWSRHHLPLITASAETFNDVMSGMAYSYGQDVVNLAAVKHNPRELDTTGTPTLFTLQKAFAVRAGESKTVRWRFSEADSDTRISTTSGITPVATTDYTANTEADGSGTDVTGNVSVSASFDAQSVELVFTNGGTQDAHIQVGSKVRGNNKLRDLGKMEVEHQDDTSIGAYGRQLLNINARLLEDQNTAQSLARWAVLNRKDARGEVRNITFLPRRNSTLMTAALARTMGDRITVTETQTGLSKDYFIVGEKHALRNGGKDYRVTWILEPADGAGQFWILNTTNFGELGQQSRLGY